MKKKKKNKMDDTSYDIEIKYSDDFLDEDDDNDDEFTNEEKRKPSIFRKIFFALILIIALTIIYSRYIATSGLTIKEYPIESDSITESINGFKIAAIINAIKNGVSIGPKSLIISMIPTIITPK